MNHLVKRAIVPLIYLLFGLVLSGCSLNLSSLPFFTKKALTQEIAEAPVERRNRFVRVIKQPVTPAQAAEQSEEAEESETEQSEEVEDNEQVTLDERIEPGPNALEPSEQEMGTNHEDKDMMPTSTEARQQGMPKQLACANPEATQAASRKLDIETTESKEEASAPKQEKVIRVHLASLRADPGSC